ncbi:hypothetical protein [Gluconobacter oxydans]|nr:hypothetical protein [Gluconobacter oxydans]
MPLYTAEQLAEARGAEEQRRKDAEACGRWEFDAPEYHSQGMGCGLEDRGIHDRYQAMEYGWNQAVERCIERIPEELYTRPANVAALEAMVKVLEDENEKFRNAMSAIATHVGGFASPNCSVDFMTSAIPEDVRLSFTALTRDGGV